MNIVDPPWKFQRALYVDLLIKCICNTIYQDETQHPDFAPHYDEAARRAGSDWPRRAHSMVGIERLKNLGDLTQRAIDEGIEGNFAETGVWRGGCCILIKGILVANRVTGRKVYLCDSFEGLPAPDAQAYPADEGLDLSRFEQLNISLDTVKSNFAVYDLLDDDVVFVKGFFRDTLPTFDPGKLALLRLDGDLYESTILALEHLYPKLSPGGYIIVDDYGCVPACAAAVEDYRKEHSIDAPMIQVDWTGVWWQKPREATSSRA
jgi:O-methyltransferase/8-demethyl-8-(2,3-dimethoxy-alpha-L-rhamnosyl)tetracenomycin-C 4'-O-methyltransferase